MNDYISRQEAIDALKGLPTWWADAGGYYGGAQPPMEALLDPTDAISAIENLPSADVQKWIQIKTRPMDDEERDYYEEHYGFRPYDDEVMFDCMMPDDGQEILVSFKSGFVSTDICDSDGGFIGLEGNGDWDGITAWMPFPKAYLEGCWNDE